jgi:Glu-tRNA(Gln) amidotransferase subunit E-like FAD-binding protein
MDFNTFKIGIELHIKISEKKLFCNCSQLFNKGENDYSITFYNNFNDTFKTNIYKYDIRNCDYEREDSLPLAPKKLHLAIAKSVAKDLNFDIFDEYKIERKHILDGSLPTGFQRTGIIGVNGNLNNIKLKEIRLEEDSCKRENNIYNTVRLGVPLLEIVSEPLVLKLTQLDQFKTFLINLAEVVRKYTTIRGIGTIRQDLNISGGIGKTELKGFQDIRKLEIVVYKELERIKQFNKRSYDYRVYEDCILVSLNNETVKGAIKEVLLYLLNIKIVEEGLNSFKIYPNISYKHSTVLNILNALRNSCFETVRRVDKEGNSHFLRYRQTKERYHAEPLLRTIHLNCIPFKQSRIVESKSLIYNEIFNQLKIKNKRDVTILLEKDYIERSFSKIQLNYIIKRLNEGENYEIVINDDAMKPFTLDLIKHVDISAYNTFNEFLYDINKKYRSHIFDYLTFKKLLDEFWAMK